MSKCTCPLGESIPSVPNYTCPQDFGQVQKLIFQRVFKSAGEKNSITKTSATKKATWQGLFTAEDSTKTIITPYVEAPSTDGGDAITFGGGNETPGGKTYNVGRNPINFSSVIRKCPQPIIKALKPLQCEDEIGVWLVNDSGYIMGQQEGASYYPFPIQSLFFGDLKLNGLETPDDNAVSFQFKPNWSDDAAVIEPEDFNALTDLANAE